MADEVEDVRDLVQTVGNTEVGKAVDVVVVRDGEQVTLSVTLGLRDDEQLARADEPRSMKMRQKTMRVLDHPVEFDRGNS